MTDKALLLDIIGENRNGWMTSFAWASSHIARAVANGRITEQEIANFVPYQPEDCIAIAKRAGIYPGRMHHVGEYYADHEDVSIAVEAITGLRDVEFGIEKNPWYFQLEELGAEPHRTLVQLEAARREHAVTYRDAARIIVEADDAYVGKVRS